MKDFWKIFSNLLLPFLLSVVQLSFINSLPVWLDSGNLVLVILLFVLAFSGLSRAWLWAIVSGAILDVYSFSPFGMNIAGLFLAVAAAFFLLTYVFTNRSLYSFLAITAVISVIHSLSLAAIIFFAGGTANDSLPQLDSGYWHQFGSGIILNMFAALVIFYLINSISRRLQPVFILKSYK